MSDHEPTPASSTRRASPETAALPADAPAVGGAEPDEATVPDRRGITSERAALWSFVAFVVVAVPLLLFHYGEFHWFFRDDFEFITERAANGMPPWLEPHGGAHLSILPRGFFWVQWKLFGLDSYVPYQAVVVALHLTAAVLIRVVMRRSGVGPWIASATAAIFVLFGPGSQNIIWAFQVGFTGSVAYGLCQLLIADHDGPIGRRDALALGFGLLAVTSSGVGITTTAAVGVAVLLRRGWRAAALQTVPLGVLVGAWIVGFDAGSASKESASPGQLLAWLAETYRATFDAFSASPVIAIAVVALAAWGLALRLRTGEPVVEALRQNALVIGLLAGGLLFVLMTAWGRAGSGQLDLAGSPRYIHIVAVSLLPLVALGIQGLADRWNRAVPLLALLLVSTIPMNVRGFEPEVFGRQYMDERRRILTTAPRVAFASEVPDWVQPIPDPYMGEVTMGFLRGAAARNALADPPNTIGPLTDAEFRVLLGVPLRPDDEQPEAPLGCTGIARPLRISPGVGDRFAVGGDFTIAASAYDGQIGPAQRFSFSVYYPKTYEVQIADLELTITPEGAGAIYCAAP